MTLRIKVKCPKCGKIWEVSQGMPDIVCNCHLYCEDGEKPTDCSLVAQSFSGNLNLFTGLHFGHSDSDDVLHRRYYCTTHGKYTYKQPVLIEVDAEAWFSKRAPKDMREIGENNIGT